MTHHLPRSAARAAAALVLGCLIFSARPASAGWTLVWSDEFSGTSVSTNWSFDNGNGSGGWGNNELEYYTSRPTNVFVSNGLLNIVARKESYKGFQYTSAKMKTLGHFSTTYGRFEFRVSLPQGTGYWPALWLMPVNNTYGGWAASGEVDIMENKGRIPTQVLGTLHYGAPYPNNVHSGTTYTLPNGGSVTNFHVYTMDWTPSQFTWYVDGVAYETQTSTSWWSSGGASPAPFNLPFYIIMNLAVGGQFDGNPDGATVFPGVMQVDYVHVYNWFTPPSAVLALRLPFTDPPGTTTSPSDASGGGVNVTMQMMDGTGAPADYHGAVGSGVMGYSDGSRALDFTSNGANQPGIPGPLAATTNAALGFGTVTNFVASLWFRQNALMTNGATNGPRLFVLGGGTPSDTGATNSIGLKFQSPTQLLFQMGNITAPFAVSSQTNYWTFVAAVYDGASISIYNGSDAAVTSLVTNFMVSASVNFGSSGALSIGNRQDRQCSFNGLVNDFRFYTGAGDVTYVENIRLLEARPPWGLTATGTNGQVSLAWGSSSGATSYNVKRSATSGGPYANLPAGVGVTNTAFIDLTAVNGTTYYYVVSTVNPAGEGALSAEASSTPSCTTTPVATNNGPVCAGSTLNLSASTVSGAAYSWTGPNEFTSSVQNPSIANVTGAASGVYSVRASVGGCSSAPAATTATVTSTPAPTAGNNSPICAGAGLNLAASTIAGASYSWTGPNGFASSEQNPSIANATPAASGTYSVTAAVGGCTSVAATTDVAVNAIPSAPTAGNSGPVCVGSALNLTASTVLGAAYSWTGPNGFTSMDQNPVIMNVSADASGSYSVIAYVNGCASPAGMTIAVVNAPPAAPTAANNGPVCAGSTLNLTASTVPGAAYSWTGPNGFTSTTQNPVIANPTTNASGTYSVVATVNGCSSPEGTTSVAVSAIPDSPTAGNNSPITVGATLNLSAAVIAGATYNWTGPNGFSSTDQNPTIANVTTNAAGVYSVAVKMGACSSAAGTTAVSVMLPVPSVTIQSVSNGLMLCWQNGTLQSATNTAGPWEDMTNAAPPSCVVAPDDLQRFFKLK